jgi:hypothetical protein
MNEVTQGRTTGVRIVLDVVALAAFVIIAFQAGRNSVEVQPGWSVDYIDRVGIDQTGDTGNAVIILYGDRGEEVNLWMRVPLTVGCGNDCPPMPVRLKTFKENSEHAIWPSRGITGSGGPRRQLNAEPPGGDLTVMRGVVIPGSPRFFECLGSTCER